MHVFLVYEQEGENMNEEKEKDRSLENGQRGEDAAELLKELGLLAGGADFKSDLQYLPIIGSIEGHSILPQDNKTTKYEHLIPELIAVEENPRIRGLLLILNTVGGDVEAGLAIAELIAGMKKPTVSLVLGGGHSIGVPLAVAAKKSFIAVSAAMTIHPVRMNGTIIAVPQAFEYLAKIQERIVDFITSHSHITAERLHRDLRQSGRRTRTD